MEFILMVILSFTLSKIYTDFVVTKHMDEVFEKFKETCAFVNEEINKISQRR